MSLNLPKLQEAVTRFERHEAACARAANEDVASERRRVAERHREMFTPPAERLLQRQMSAVVAAAGTGRAVAVETPARLVTVGGIVPEVAIRDNDLRPIRFLEIATLASRSVGRIRITDSLATEEGDATGFLIAPGVLMTNWHVLKTADFAAAATVIFDDEDGLNGEPKDPKAFRLKPDDLFVSHEELDYAIVGVALRTLEGVPLSQFGYLRLFEQTGKLDPTQRQAANIIQHPGGGSKKIALRDNYFHEVVPDGVDPGKQLNSIFYGTDTLKGSSGSPVCSDQWYVVALHRGGVPETQIIDGARVIVRRDGTPAFEGDSRNLIRYVANEGTRVSRIYRSLRQKSQNDAHAAQALERIAAVSTDPRGGPLSLRTAPIRLPALPSAEEGGPEEIIRRKIPKFEAATGYQAGFLGTNFRVPLPEMTSDVKRELATLKNSTRTELKYDHYSLKINGERRTAVFAAGNIDGGKLWKNHQGFGALPARPQWSFDPRMDEAFQPDDDIFSTAMQRGHLYKREDAVWGIDKPAMTRADEHSFTITNATPMISNFNNVEWGDLEDIITRESEVGNRVSYFAGPVFRSTDRFFNELRANVPAADRFRGMRVPETFWKIVFWVEQGKLKAAGFVLVQTDEIAAHGPITEEINFGKYRKRRVNDIEALTGLKFPKLVAVDTFDE